MKFCGASSFILIEFLINHLSESFVTHMYMIYCRDCRSGINFNITVGKDSFITTDKSERHVCINMRNMIQCYFSSKQYCVVAHVLKKLE